MNNALVMAEGLTARRLLAAALYFDRIIAAPPRRAEEDPPSFTERYRHVPTAPAYLIAGLEGELAQIYSELRDQSIMREVFYTDDFKDGVARPLVEAITTLGSDEDSKRYRFDGEAWPLDGACKATEIERHWISPALKECVIRNGLGFYKENIYMGRWYLRVPTIFAQIYYSSLMESIARQNLASSLGGLHSPVYGSSLWDPEEIGDVIRSGSFPATDHRSAEEISKRLKGTLGILAVHTVTLAGAIDPQLTGKVLKIRQRHRDELTRFQQYVSEILESDSLAADITNETPGEVLREYLQVKYETEIYPGLVELERSLKAVGLQTVWGTLSMKVALPPGVALAISAALPHSAWSSGIALGAGVSLGLANAISSHAKFRRNARVQSPQAYLHSLRAETPRAAVRRMRLALPPPTLDMSLVNGD